MKRYDPINHTYGSYVAMIVIVAMVFWTFGINTAKAEETDQTKKKNGKIIEMPKDLDKVGEPIKPILITDWLPGSNAIPTTQYYKIDNEIARRLQECKSCIALVKGGNSTEKIITTCYFSPDHSHYTLKASEKMPFDRSIKNDVQCNEHLSRARAKAIELYLVELSRSSKYDFKPGQIQPTTLTGTNMYGAEHAVNRGVAVLIINTTEIVQYNVELLKENCPTLAEFLEIPEGCWAKIWIDETGEMQKQFICDEEERDFELANLFAEIPEQKFVQETSAEEPVTKKKGNNAWKWIAGGVLLGLIGLGVACTESKVDNGDPSVKNGCW